MKQVVNLAPSDSAELTYSFMIISALVVFWVIAATQLKDGEIKKTESSVGIRKAFSLFTPKERKIVIDMGIMQAVTGLGAALTVQFYTPFFIQKFNASTQELYLMATVGIIVLAFTTYFSGEMGGRSKKLKFIQTANLVAVPMALGMLISPIFFLAAGFYIARYAMANMVWPVWAAFYMGNIRKEMRGAANGFGQTVWNLVYIPAAFIGWEMMKWTNGWTIPIAALMYFLVTAYVRWHLRELGES